MAEIILTDVLNEKISIEELFQWLTSNDPEAPITADVEQNGFTRANFISYFLNYLREQSKSILPDFKDVQQEKLDKKAPNGAQKAVLPENQSQPSARFNRHGGPTVQGHGPLQHSHSSSPFPVNVAPMHPQMMNPANMYPPNLMSPQCDPRESYQTANMIHNAGQNARYRQPQVYNSPGQIAGLSPQAGYSGNTSPAHFPSLPYRLNSSSPTVSSNRIHEVQRQSMNHQLSGPQFQRNELNLSTNTNTPFNSPNANYSGADTSSLHQSLAQKCLLNVSSSPGVLDNSFSNASTDIGSPSRHENSLQNCSSSANAPFSPLSPIYANNVSVPGRRKTPKSHDKTGNSQEYAGSAFSSRSNTPLKSPAGSGQKVTKGTQNPNLCLGDFLKVDSHSKKGSRKHSRTQQYRKTPDESQLANDGSDSPASGAKSKRRINPTRLNVSGGDKVNPGTEVFGVISRPTVANPKFVEAPSTDKSREEVTFEAERELLKLERQRKPQNESTSESINAVEQKMPIKQNKPQSTVVACVNLVENIEILNILANVYSGILDRNLMANPMTELYFLVTLLTTQYKAANEEKNTPTNSDNSVSSVQLLKRLKDDLGCAELKDEIDEDNPIHPDENIGDKSSENCAQDYLGTAHNCVYFATMVMLNQQFLLSTLDRVTLKLLCENPQVIAFQPELQNYLNEIYKVKCQQTKSIKQTDLGCLPSNVCFQVDTDNRGTFPSSTSFSLFRKQRDLFYDILKDWEDNHLNRNWSFVRSARNKINTLLSLHTDAVNHCHFAKLFVSQLLVSSIQSGQTEDPINDESLSFLKSLKDVNPEKLMQLKGRLVTPLTSTGPVPKPIFPGVQEFYKDFILNANDWKFRVILETTIIHEIMELNDTQFTRSEIDGTETTVDENTKQNFITCVSSLRLLAKFMGFTVSLSFNTEVNSPEWLVSQIHLRGRVQPSLDLQCCLVDSMTCGRLLLTVPWIVQYMSMLDTITLRLPYYINIGEKLYRIYRISNQHNSTDLMSPQTATLMMFTIGWLFELPNFPRDLYVYWQINYDDKMRQIFGQSDENERTKELDIKSVDVNTSLKEAFAAHHNSSLDKLDVIDDRALYECCPFLTEFKILLVSGNAVLGNTNANRHITPVSSQLSQPTFGAKTQNLQMQLEELFFRGQPSSMRKTVDFVSERVASSCVKFICNSLIPMTKQRNLENFVKSKNQDIKLIIKYYSKEDKEDEENLDVPTVKEQTEKPAKLDAVERQTKSLASLMKDDVKRDYKKQMSIMCKERTIKSIESLIADDTLPTVKETCTAIAMRMATERIDEWAELHITDDLFMKNLPRDLKNLLNDLDVLQTNKEKRHDPEAPCSTETIGMMRKLMWDLLDKKQRPLIKVHTVKETLACLRQTLTHRTDLVDGVEKNLHQISVELCLLLLSNRPDLWTADIQEELIRIWKTNNLNPGSEGEELSWRIISPRNIRLLTTTSNKTVLKVFGRLLKSLLKENLLNIEALSDQCVALFRQEWPETILKELSQCLNEAVEDYKGNSAHAECVKNLLVWIATTCNDMDNCGYD